MVIAVTTIPLAWRRSRPLAALLGSTTVASLAVGAPEATTTFLVLVVATFSGAAYSRHLVVVVAAALVACLAHGLNDP